MFGDASSEFGIVLDVAGTDCVLKSGDSFVLIRLNGGYCRDNARLRVTAERILQDASEKGFTEQVCNVCISLSDVGTETTKRTGTEYAY